MLVLSRKVNESIVIDGDIRITVLDIRGNHVRLGIEAPAAVAVLREELRLRAQTDIVGDGRVETELPSDPTPKSDEHGSTTSVPLAATPPRPQSTHLQRIRHDGSRCDHRRSTGRVARRAGRLAFADSNIDS